MADFLLLMHTDGGLEPDDAWPAYLQRLKASGHLRGGSEIGSGECFRRA